MKSVPTEIAPVEAAPITGHYQTSVREYLRQAPALNRGTKFSNGFGVLAVLLAILNLPALIPAAVEMALALALFSGYYCVPFTWLTLRSRRRQVEQPIDVLADDDGIHFTQGPVQIDVTWDSTTRLREDRDYFFLMARYPRAYVFPKRAFDPAELEALQALASSKGKLRRSGS